MNQCLKFRWKFLYSFFPFSFRLLGIGCLALQRSFTLFSKPCCVHLFAVRNKRTNFRRNLLQPFFFFRFYLCRVASLLPRRNDTVIPHGVFLFDDCFLSFIQCLLSRVQFCFPLSKLRLSCRILSLAGANHYKTDER